MAVLALLLTGIVSCHDGGGTSAGARGDGPLAEADASLVTRAAATTRVLSPSGPAGGSGGTATTAGGTAAPQDRGGDGHYRDTPPLQWEPCGGFDCATLVVPWDEGTPSAADAGRTMSLPVVRRPATGPGERLGSIVLNPGGPGGSGVSFLRAAAPSMQPLNERFDLVSFDPRGVNAADPALVCRASLDDDVDIIGAGGLSTEQFTRELTAFHDSCAGDNAELVTVLGTDHVAADLDRLRDALGDEQLTYFGFSYGTRIGAVYAHLYGDRIRAMVLDGADVSVEHLAESVAAQYRAFDEAFTRFAASCPATAGGGSCATSGDGGAGAVFRKVETQLQTSPVPAGAGRQLTAGELYLGAAAALYDRSTWDSLDRALAAGLRGDGTEMQALADSLEGRRRDGSYTNLYDANIGVNCADNEVRPTAQQAIEQGARLAAELTWFGPLATAAYVDCVGWPAADPTGAAAHPAANGGAPVLVVGTTGDPATPFAWAEELAHTIPNGVLIRREGEGHTAYFSSPCVQRTVAGYLIDPSTAQPSTCSS